jgi:hypothetical protein
VTHAAIKSSDPFFRISVLFSRRPDGFASAGRFVRTSSDVQTEAACHTTSPDIYTCISPILTEPSLRTTDRTTSEPQVPVNAQIGSDPERHSDSDSDTHSDLGPVNESEMALSLLFFRRRSERSIMPVTPKLILIEEEDAPWHPLRTKQPASLFRVSVDTDTVWYGE